MKNILSQKWAISPEGAAWVASRLKMMEAAAKFDPIRPGARPETDVWGQPLQKLTTENGIGIVPIHGVMMKGADDMDRRFGFISHDEVRTDIETALRHGVRGIVLDINSPGGTVSGTPELADFVSRLEVPTFAFSDNLMASAAYYIAAGATQIYSTRSATIGSIGTILSLIDATKLFESMGIKWEIFTSGQYKGTGHPGMALSEAQREFLQGLVNEDALEFKSHIQTYRPDVEDGDMQGQWFSGSAAKKRKMVDDNYDTMQLVLDFFG